MALCPQAFATRGFALAPGLVQPPLLRAIASLMRARAERVMAALGERPIGIGSREGYHELVQRSPGRWDVPLTEANLAPIWGERGSTAAGVPWMPLVQEALGRDASPSFCGVVFSRPGSPAQQWHIDSPHESDAHLPAHAVNVLLALEDVPLTAGPTEVAAGTHILSNHLLMPSLSKDDLLYQTENEITPESLHNTAQQQKALEEKEQEAWKQEARKKTRGKEENIRNQMARVEKKLEWLAKAEDARGTEDAAAEAPLRSLRAGDCMIFDDRLLHRGGANASDTDRWVAYFSYIRPRPGLGEVDDTHFEATRSLGLGFAPVG